jgi:hypothetical protein
MNAGLARYLLAAILVRGADSGAIIGLILLAAPMPEGAAVGGALAATLTAPHLLGPLLGHWLDRTADPRRLLAGAYALYAVAVVLGGLSLRTPVLSFFAVAVAGACGPLLTGGLSSRLPELARPDRRSQRRAQGWDGITYGIGGTAGPAVVAGVAAFAGPGTALWVIGGAVTVGAVLVGTLPAVAAEKAAATASLRTSLRLIVTDGGLRRITTLTLVTALGLGALPVVAAVLGAELTGHSSAGAALTAAFGFGSLVGALLVTAFPFTGEPDAATIRGVAAVAVTAALVAAAPTYGLAVAGFAAVGVANALFFTATLAGRASYAPAQARSQVFVTSAGLKIAMSSAGAAAAGVLAGWGGRTLLLAIGILTACGTVAGLADRLLAGGRQQLPGPRPKTEPLVQADGAEVRLDNPDRPVIDAALTQGQPGRPQQGRTDPARGDHQRVDPAADLANRKRRSGLNEHAQHISE